MEDAYIIHKVSVMLTVAISQDGLLKGTEVTRFVFHGAKLSSSVWFTEDSVKQGLADNLAGLLKSSCQM